RIPGAVGAELERAHRPALVRHSAALRGDEAHRTPLEREGAATCGDRGVVENEGIALVAAEAVNALLQPEKARERQPSAVTRERFDAPRTPLADLRLLGLRIDAGARGGGNSREIQGQRNQQGGGAGAAC